MRKFVLITLLVVLVVVTAVRTFDPAHSDGANLSYMCHEAPTYQDEKRCKQAALSRVLR